jgi:hypothetical protein
MALVFSHIKEKKLYVMQNTERVWKNISDNAENVHRNSTLNIYLLGIMFHLTLLPSLRRRVALIWPWTQIPNS